MTARNITDNRNVIPSTEPHPTYHACISSTAFTDIISTGTLGAAFCILESGKIVGVQVVSESSTTSDYTLQVIVWRNTS